ncbi:uncharacterized protein LOC135492468 [Lineus longissimus]|uniref:uncharacterized protein LOC135492468 n=1 Tax=Lineus longissimus TaxID=88925 RepID=UPI00315CE326
MSSGLILAFMSVDRFIAIRFPMAAKRICTPAKAKVTIVTTAVIVITLNVSTFFVHTYTKDEASGHPEYELLFSNFQMIFGSVLPSMIIMGSNLGIIVTVRRASRKRAVMSGQDGQVKDSQLTRMLIVDEASGLESIFLSVPGHPEYELLFSNFQMIFGSLLPSMIIMGSNLGIIVTVRRASRKRAVMSGQDGQDKDSQLTRMLIVG